MDKSDAPDRGRYKDGASIGGGVIAFPLSATDKTVVLFENDGPESKQSGRVQIALGGGQLVDRANAGLKEALASVRPAAELLLDQFRSIGDEVAEVELEFGLKLTGEVGAIIARTSAEGHCTVKLKFVRARKEGGPAGGS